MIKLLTWCIFLASQTISFTVQAENLRHIRCGKLIDGISNEVRNDQLIVINKDRIEAVEEFNETLNIDFELIDLKNYTCLPGLIDTHTHITEKAGDTADLSIYFTMIKDDVRRISEKNALTTLNAGFTSVRNVGAYIAWSARDLRDRINQGYVIGPRIQTAGFYLTVPGGGGDLLLPDYPEEKIPSYVREGVSKNAQEFRENAKIKDSEIAKKVNPFKYISLKYRLSKRFGAFKRFSDQGFSPDEARIKVDKLYPMINDDYLCERDLITVDKSWLGLIVLIFVAWYFNNN